MTPQFYGGKACLSADYHGGDRCRQEYLEGLTGFIQKEKTRAKQQRKAWVSPESMAQNREEYRKKYLAMLGMPELPPEKPNVRKELIGEDAFGTVYRMQVEVLPDVWFYGLLSMPHQTGKLPLIIAQHGGSGTPELCCDLCGKNSYAHFSKRALEAGFAVFSPQLLIWNHDPSSPDFLAVDIPYDRVKLDAELKQFGMTLTGFEIFCIRRCLDYLVQEAWVIADQIGMMGISYGGYFSLHTAAADTRIKAIYAAASFNDRNRELFPDWGYFRAAEQFLDAEVVGLCAPRKVFFDVGKADQVFDYRGAVSEAEAAREYYTAIGHENRFSFHLWDGGHTFDADDNSFDEFFQAVKENLP